MNIIKINLLPWREALQAKQEDNFKKYLIFAVIMGILLGFLINFGVGKYYEQQEKRIVLLDAELQKPQYIEASKNLRRQQALVEDLTNKLNVLSDLNNQRADMVALLEQLASSKEEGVSIQAIDFKQEEIAFSGLSLTQEKLIAFIQNLEKEVGLTPIPTVREQSLGDAEVAIFGIKINPEIRKKEKDEE